MGSRQALIQKKGLLNSDLDRVLRFASFGLVDGVMGHAWYKNLDLLVERALEPGAVAVATKGVSRDDVNLP